MAAKAEVLFYRDGILTPLQDETKKSLGFTLNNKNILIVTNEQHLTL